MPLEKSKNAKDGELVEVMILKFPDEGSFEGDVLSVIGDAKNPLNDIKRVVITQNIAEHFSAETLAESKKFNADPTEKDFQGRKNLRHLPIITIDGATAKDFDDAVLVEMTDKGFHLYVAIADVSHYVAANTSMDKEAYERGTSVYFPNFVIPMLPETISNGLCSLMPNVPRLALVAEMSFDFTGEMTSSSFYEGVIESKARVTYGEAQELIDGVSVEKLNHVKENIFKCADLAKVLMAKRFKDGALDLEVPETVLVIDAAGEPVDVIKSERLFAHRLIEELMLAANVAVAKFLGKQGQDREGKEGAEPLAFYRIHEAPDAEKISKLQKYMENLGHKTTLSGGKLQKRLTRALQDFDGKPEAQIIHILTLRSMSQAKYTPNNIGHFGLGFDFYTHFTSPIRRYPDLIVHRLLKNRLMPNSRYRAMAEADLLTAGTWLSSCEQKAAKAERQIQAIKKARFMLKLVGESYDGLISSVTKFGFFVLLREFNIDGLVRLDDLGHHDKWEFNEENLTLTAKKSGFSYKMGDVVRVTVSLVDVEQGQINFLLEKNAKDNARPTIKKKQYTRPQNRSQDKFAKKQTKFFEPHKKTYSEPIKPTSTSQEKPTGKDYEPKPRYTSLSDYLDQRKKGPNEEKSESKPAFRSVKNRANSEKRSSPQNNSGGLRKTRSKKSSRNNKSR
ncbi:MAG: ribonuclease R [Bdellovibrionota bacterium]